MKANAIFNATYKEEKEDFIHVLREYFSNFELHSNEKRSVYDFIRLFFVRIPLRYQRNRIAKYIP